MNYIFNWASKLTQPICLERGTRCWIPDNQCHACFHNTLFKVKKNTPSYFFLLLSSRLWILNISSENCKYTSNISLLIEHCTMRALLRPRWITLLFGHQVQELFIGHRSVCLVSPLGSKYCWLTHFCKNNGNNAGFRPKLQQSMAPPICSAAGFQSVAVFVQQNPRKAEVGRDLWKWSGPAPAPAWPPGASTARTWIHPLRIPHQDLLLILPHWTWETYKMTIKYDINSVFRKSGSALTSTTWFYNKNILYPLPSADLLRKREQ